MQSGRTARIDTFARAATAAAAMVTSDDPLERLMERIVWILPPVSTTIARRNGEHLLPGVERAEEDLRLANHAMTMKTAIPYRLVAYHAQQRAEKCLKAYLVAGMTDFPHTHNIGALLELCAPTAAWVPEVQDAEALSTYAVTARYPGGPDRVSRREAVVAIAHAERVLKRISGDLKSKKFL